MTPLVTVALGGNALSPPSGDTGLDAERVTIARAAAEVVATCGHARLLVVHGNGTQVGRSLATDPDLTHLDVRVAQTQGELGYLLAHALESAGLEGGRCVALVTRALVAADDPAWTTPVKPIGPLLAQAPVGIPTVTAGPNGRVRCVVASPKPRAIVEMEAIRLLLAAHHVIAGGGGGVALVETPDGRSAPRPAVIDKDHVAALLAVALGAERLVFVTNVSAAYDRPPHPADDPSDPARQPLRTMALADARARLDDGAFGAGSMAPKVESAVTFVEATGRPAVIAGLGEIAAALRGDAGTTIHR